MSAHPRYHLYHSYLTTALPQASFPWDPPCLQHPSVTHPGNPHGGALLPFEILALTACPMTFSSAAFLIPWHAITLPLSKHFPQGNTSRSGGCDTGATPGFQPQLTWLDLQPHLPSLRKTGRWEAAQQKEELHLGQHVSCAICRTLQPCASRRPLPFWRIEGLISLYLSPKKATVCCPATSTDQTGLLVLVSRRPREPGYGCTGGSKPDSSTAGSQIQSKIRPSGPPLLCPFTCSLLPFPSPLLSFSPSHLQKVSPRESHCHSDRPSMPALTWDQQSQTDVGSASSARSLGFAVLSLLPQRGCKDKDTDPVEPGWLLTREQAAAVPWCLWVCHRAQCNPSRLTSPAHLFLQKPGSTTGHFLPFKACWLSSVHSWSDQVSSLAPPGTRTLPLGIQQLWLLQSYSGSWIL